MATCFAAVAATKNCSFDYQWPSSAANLIIAATAKEFATVREFMDLLET